MRLFLLEGISDQLSVTRIYFNDVGALYLPVGKFYNYDESAVSKFSIEGLLIINLFVIKILLVL